MLIVVSLVVVIVVMTVGFLAAEKIRRWRFERHIAALHEQRTRSKGAAAHKELVRLFPNRDPSERTRIVKAMSEVDAGDIIRTHRDAHDTIHVESPATDPDSLGSYDYRVVTGFTKARRRASTFVSTVDLDGYGSTAFPIRKDAEVVAYVDRSNTTGDATGS